MVLNAGVYLSLLLTTHTIAVFQSCCASGASVAIVLGSGVVTLTTLGPVPGEWVRATLTCLIRPATPATMYYTDIHTKINFIQFKIKLL